MLSSFAFCEEFGSFSVMTFLTQNPHSGDLLKEYSYFTDAEIQRALIHAQKSFSYWRKEPLEKRAIFLQKVAKAIREKSTTLSKQMTLEMGKPLSEAQAEVEKCAVTLEYFAEHAPLELASIKVDAHYEESFISKEPLGVVFAIMPWNYPLWQMIRFAAPAWMAGNVIALKHSDMTAGTAEIFCEIVQNVSPIRDVIVNLRINHDQAAKIIADPRIAAVTFTGSTRGGSEIAKVAGQNLKKTVLELGGSDAYVVLKDADIAHAAKVCATARLVNNGQSCVSAKRFVVEEAVLPVFLQEFTKAVSQFVRGNPMESATKLGPLANKKFQRGLVDQCTRLEKSGAERLDLVENKDSVPFDLAAPGAYFPPRVYLVSPENEVAKTEEFFGPVAIVIPVKSEAQAIEVANSSLFGLGGAIFTRDIKRAKELAHQMECGFVAINDQVKSDARMPFGGVKASGYGRELSKFGLQEFLNIKSLGIRF